MNIPLLKTMREIWTVVQSIRVALLIIIAGWLSFLLPDQSQDFYVSFKGDGFNQHAIMYFIFLLLWSGLLWQTTTLVLIFSEIGGCNKNNVRKHFVLLPVALASISILLFGFNHWYVYHLCKFQNGAIVFVGYIVLAFVVGFGLAFYQFKKIERLEQKQEGLFGVSAVEMSNYFSVDKWLRAELTFILLTFIVGVVLSIFSPKALIHISVAFGPAAVILCSLFFLTFWGMAINLVSNKVGFPVLPLVLIVPFIFSFTNNNHELRSVENLKRISSAQNNDAVYFGNWLENLKPNTSIDSTKKAEPIKIILVAAEGGGSRAAYWAAVVLCTYYEKNPGSFQHTFALSGASGGAVGIMFFNALAYHTVEQKNGKALTAEDFKKMKMQLDTICGGDFLSPLTTGMALPDALQKFLPFAIGKFDRGRYLEDAFAKSFEEVTQSYLLNEGVDSLYHTPNKIPSLFFNCTHVETGRKSIISNLQLSPKYFKDVLDVETKIEKSILLKTAVSCASRFPMVTPPALMIDTTGKPFGHLVDGGYFDNTGIETCLQLSQMMLNTAHNKGIPVRIKIMGIINCAKPDTAPALGFNYEAAPVVGFYNSWLRRAISNENMAARIGELTGEISYERFELNVGENKIFPLGWYLSNNARKQMMLQADALSFK